MRRRHGLPPNRPDRRLMSGAYGCITASGLPYVLPYLLVVPENQRRYLFWFYIASFFALIQAGIFLYNRYTLIPRRETPATGA